MLVDVGDTRLNVVERGTADGLALIVLHGGPGLDHTEFGRHLDPLGDEFRLLLVDMRAQGGSDRDAPPETWTVPRFAADVDALARALELDRYVVLGHSFGAFVALRHALDHDRARPPAATIVSSGVPGERWMAGVQAAVDAIEDEELRSQVLQSFEREEDVDSEEGVLEILRDQFPFHFADPQDPRIEAALEDLEHGRMAPDVLRVGSQQADLEVEDRLNEVRHPVLVLTGRHDRLTTPEAAVFMAEHLPVAELVVFERSAHMAFNEEPEAYTEAVRDFLTRAVPGEGEPPPSPPGAPG
jgi:proline iminopeptidase